MILETECEACSGTGQINPMKNIYGKCYTCDGRGKILTTEGQELIDFIKHYLGDYFEIYRSPED